MRPSRQTGSRVALVAAVTLALGVGVAPASAHPPHPGHSDKVPVATGYGGAVTTVDADATRVGLDVLRRGGNAVDAAVAAAATLGVTEPFSAGIGGGGFFVYYDAATGQVHTIDGRETAPMAMQSDAFVENGVPIPFADAVTSGLSVGVPGTPRTWATALDQWGSLDLRQALSGATDVARRGFVVDQTFVDQTDRERRAVRRLPVHGGPLPARAVRPRRSGRSSATATWPTPTTCSPVAGSTRSTPAASPRTSSAPSRSRRSAGAARSSCARASWSWRPRGLRGAAARTTHVSYRGLDVYGMAPPSSGGSTVGEALNILEARPAGPFDTTQTLHRYLEASALAFADRNRYVGDPAFVDVPAGAAALRRVRGRARLPDRPDRRADQAGGARRAGRRLRRLRAAAAVGTEGTGRSVHDAPDDRGPLGQRGGVHADHRVDRRQRDRRAGPRLPAQQRADRLQLHRHPGRQRPEPARSRQAAAQLDGADHRPGRRHSRSWRSAPPAGRPSSRRCCRSS